LCSSGVRLVLIRSARVLLDCLARGGQGREGATDEWQAKLVRLLVVDDDPRPGLGLDGIAAILRFPPAAAQALELFVIRHVDEDSRDGAATRWRRKPMRIFLAGASGAIGRPLTTMLVAAGHEVTGTTRSTDGAATIEARGARAVIVDVFDATALRAAVRASRPGVVIHQLTNLTLKPGEALGDEQLAQNAEVREIGTRNLVEAAAEVGARRLIAQSIAWLYLAGHEPHIEEDSIVPAGGAIDRGRAGVIELERLVTKNPVIDGVVLRYGRFYGPGTWDATPPRPPTVHVDAAARAAALAVDRGDPGIYNIVDDGRPVSNAKARRLLGWAP
jgi:nucleoside-diphosphate-sugar epimerase